MMPLLDTLVAQFDTIARDIPKAPASDADFADALGAEVARTTRPTATDSDALSSDASAASDDETPDADATAASVAGGTLALAAVTVLPETEGGPALTKTGDATLGGSSSGAPSQTMPEESPRPEHAPTPADALPRPDILAEAVDPVAGPEGEPEGSTAAEMAAVSTVAATVLEDEATEGAGSKPTAPSHTKTGAAENPGDPERTAFEHRQSPVAAAVREVPGPYPSSAPEHQPEVPGDAADRRSAPSEAPAGPFAVPAETASTSPDVAQAAALAAEIDADGDAPDPTLDAAPEGIAGLPTPTTSSGARPVSAPPALPARLAVPAWIGAAVAAGARAVQVALGADGTVRFQAEREADGVTVRLQFSDPDLHALAGAHAARLRDVLEAHFSEPVHLALGDAGAEHAGTDAGHAGADRGGSPSPSSASAGGPSSSDRPAPRSFASGRREWIG